MRITSHVGLFDFEPVQGQGIALK